MPDPQPGAAPDPAKLRHQIQFVRDTLRRLGEIRARGPEAFLSDHILQAAAVRGLQIGVEAVLDAANHIIAREGLGLPRTYQESIDLLIRHGVLPRDRADAFAVMVRFRNRAVHLYDEIDPAEILRILDGHLGDFEAFIAAIVERYLRR